MSDYPYPHDYNPPQGQPLPAPTSGLAVWSMILGILSVFFGVIPAVAAVIMGHQAIKTIRLTGKRGEKMAIAGLILGYISIAFFWLYLLVLLATG